MNGLMSHAARLAKSSRIAAVAIAMIGLGSTAEASTLASSVVVAHQNDQVTCLATKINGLPTKVEVFIIDAKSEYLLEDEGKTMTSGETMIVSYLHQSAAVGLYRCEISLQGAPRRSFRGRIWTDSDSQPVN